MKPFYNLPVIDALGTFFKINYRLKKLLLYFSIMFFIFFGTILFIIYQYQFFLLCLIFVICVASVQHMRVFSWFGGFDLNTILTVFVSMKFGLSAGLFVGTASVVGLILAGDIDNSLFFDLVFSYIIAIISSFFTLSMFVPIVTIMALLYFISYLFYHFIMRTMEIQNIVWGVTNCLWILFVMYKVIPIIF